MKSFLKKCRLCNEDKELNEFHKNKSKKYGCKDECKRCLKKYYYSPEGKAKKIFTETRRRAKIKKIKFDLTEEWLEEKIKKGVCEYTGLNFDFSFQGKYSYNPYGPSIDRIDSNKGYTKDNCQLVCHFVNNMKSEYSDEDFIKFCESVLYKKHKMLLVDLK